MKINEVILKPILTEKATGLATNKVYMFEISKKSNKNKVKEAIESLYSVKVAKISIMNRKGKKRRVGRRMKTKIMPVRKIAVVKVKEGKISLFPEA